MWDFVSSLMGGGDAAKRESPSKSEAKATGLPPPIGGPGNLRKSGRAPQEVPAEWTEFFTRVKKQPPDFYAKCIQVLSNEDIYEPSDLAEADFDSFKRNMGNKDLTTRTFLEQCVAMAKDEKLTNEKAASLPQAAPVTRSVSASGTPPNLTKSGNPGGGANASGPQATLSILAVGARVRLHGLAQDAAYNGKVGVVQKFVPGAERCRVMLEDGEVGYFKIENVVVEAERERQQAAEPAVLQQEAMEETIAEAFEEAQRQMKEKAAKAFAEQKRQAEQMSLRIARMEVRGVTSAAQLDLRPRTRVQLQRLQSDTGKKGEIQQFDSETQQYIVDLDDGTTKHVKPENLDLDLKAQRCIKEFTVTRNDHDSVWTSTEQTKDKNPCITIVRQGKAVRPVGSGGQGTVVKAEIHPHGEQQTMQVVAAKGAQGAHTILDHSNCQEPKNRDEFLRFTARFDREVRAYQDLEHPNLIGLKGLAYEEIEVKEKKINGVVHPGFDIRVPVWILTEYDENARSMRAELTSRRDKLKQMDALASQNVPYAKENVEYAKQVLQGLSYMHRNGYVHCDLSSANVVIYPGPTIKLIDFGVTHRKDEKGTITEKDTCRMCHPHYMCPEGASIPERPSRDMFAFGTMLFEMMTLEDAAHCRPTHPRGVVPPQFGTCALHEVALKCINQVSSERPDAEDALKDLRVDCS